MVSIFLIIVVQCKSVVVTLTLTFVNVLVALSHFLQQYLLVMH